MSSYDPQTSLLMGGLRKERIAVALSVLFHAGLLGFGFVVAFLL